MRKKKKNTQKLEFNMHQAIKGKKKKLKKEREKKKV